MNALGDFYKEKRILVTGHTGFKGSWLCKVLEMLGADIVGYSLKPPTTPSLFEICNIHKNIESVYGDIRDYDELYKTFSMYKPEIVIHMAAQPIVRESYKDPRYTYSVNVMGTVNVLECVRNTDSVKSFINVTTDKVYLNKEWEWGYREYEELNGFDPYSNSKSCSELVTSSYKNSFFTSENAPAISTCRAGNVIGGGDFAIDRIIPDCVRAVEANDKIIVRNPYSIRPYQHVLEPVVAYLVLAMKQYGNRLFAGSYNIGPGDSDCWTTGALVSKFCEEWNKLSSATNAVWIERGDFGPHEANFLKLDCSKIKKELNWNPIWDINIAMQKIVEWYVAYVTGGDSGKVMEMQIREYLCAINDLYIDM